MSSQLRFAVENRKRHLIDVLIGAGVFKIRDRQLYELSLEELEKVRGYGRLCRYSGIVIYISKESWLHKIVASSLYFVEIIFVFLSLDGASFESSFVPFVFILLLQCLNDSVMFINRLTCWNKVLEK